MPCPSDLHGRRQAERRGRREVESGVHCAKMGYFYAARAVWLGLFGEKPTAPAGERPESWESDPTRAPIPDRIALPTTVRRFLVCP